MHAAWESSQWKAGIPITALAVAAEAWPTCPVTKARPATAIAARAADCVVVSGLSANVPPAVGPATSPLA